MFSLARLRRAILLLALFPPLLLSGLGRFVVLCSTDDGHVQMEVLADGCCENTVVVTGATQGPQASSSEEGDCGPCSDDQVALNLPSQRVEGSGLQPPTKAQPNPATPAAARFARPAAAVLARGHVRPHLSHIRSVSLRC